MTAAVPTTTTALPFFRLSDAVGCSIDAGAPLHALLWDAQCVLGASLASLELQTDSQCSEAFWGALYLLRQGVALLNAAQTIPPACGPLVGAAAQTAAPAGGAK